MVSDVTFLQADLTQPITFKIIVILFIIILSRNYVPDE